VANPGTRLRGLSIARIVRLSLASALLAACQTRGPIALDEPGLRAELRRLLPEVAEQELVVPYAVDPATVLRARKIAERSLNPQARALSLADSLAETGSGFGLRYAWALHNSAQETLAAGEGTCMGLSSVLVGIARATGLPAYYVDASEAPELREESDVRVVSGHIAVVIGTQRGPTYVDFTGVLLPERRYRVIGDLEAAAHYYNNRGYELIHRAESEGLPIPWPQVREQFARAVRIAPGFARGWNNLGVAQVRLGQTADAVGSYRRALELQPSFASPQRNLTALGTADDAGTLTTEPPAAPASGSPAMRSPARP
jgi:tetratricopeptide (TPR) repeat protein